MTHVLVEALSVGRDICSSTRPSHGLPECQLGSGNYPRQSPLCDPCACRSSLCQCGTYVPALAHHTDFPSVSWAVVIIHVNHLCVTHVLVEALSVGRDICSSTRPSHGLPECQLGSGNYPRQSPLCDPCACRSSLCQCGTYVPAIAHHTDFPSVS